ncbi:AAA family ATPase [Photobacterium sp. BZF1]|uniref:KAP family P-loop NTPase fold protein n=1 Tax=Photobacterium sp. BZF1 TaxID=1904457 RepID=UPI0016538761|nr:P-loop NTPase fold protein [Photobacterium sp. BZF1]MBC7001732.1 AAA family ATPase [Photobacterium sp. BZF1]
MTSYHNDQPIITANDDQLNRFLFCRSLANIANLDVGSPCITISIEGAWGTGKTSIINLVQESLSKSKNQPIVAHYNPWVNGKEKSLVEDFLIQFTSQLGLSNHANNGAKVAKELLSYSKLFNVAKLVPGVEPFGSIVENIFKGAGEATEAISELKKLDVQAQKQKVINSLEKLNKSIVIIIDDIDRLTPSECFQVLRLVKAVADFPRTSFLLAFDPDYLESVLASNNISNAGQYIDKIIQLRLPVPIITEYDQNNLVNSAFKQLGSDFTFDHYQDDRERFADIYQRNIKKLLTSPRDIKRAINHFKFVYQLVKHEVSTTDLFVLSVLATKYNRIYEHIKRNPFKYASKYNGRAYIFDKEEAAKEAKGERCAIYTQMGLNNESTVEELLKDIFPIIENEFYFDSYGVDDADAAGRVDSIDRLSTALHISTPKGLCSDNDVRLYIDNADNKIDLLTDSINNQSTARFLELFGYELEKYEHKVDCYIHALRRLTEELMARRLFHSVDNLFDGMFLSTSHYSALCRLIRKLIRKQTKREEKIARMTSVIGNFSLLPFIADTIDFISLQHQAKSKEPAWLLENEASDIMDIYINAAREVIEEQQIGSQILEYHLVSPIWSWRKDKALEIIKAVNPDDALRLGYLCIGSLGSNSNKGLFLSVDAEKLELFVDPSKIKRRATELLESTSEPLDRAILLSITDESQRYVQDGTVEEN